MNFYLDPSDLVMKGKFNFWNDKMKLSGKSKLNTDKGVRVSSDYYIDVKVSKDSAFRFTHKDDGTTNLEGNFFVHRFNDLTLSAYLNSRNKQDEKNKTINQDFYFRLLHQKFLVSFGVKDWDLTAHRTNDKNEQAWCPTPKTLAGSVHFAQKHGDFSGLVGTHSGINLDNKKWFTNWLLGLRHDKGTGYLSLNLTKEEHKLGLNHDIRLNQDYSWSSDVSYTHRVAENQKDGEKPKDCPSLLNVTQMLEVNVGNNTRLKVKVIFFFLYFRLIIEENYSFPTFIITTIWLISHLILK